MLRLLKALPLALAIAALSIVATSCSSNGTHARFVNAIQDTSHYGADNGGALNVEVNGVQQFTGVTFGTPGSGYIGLSSGNVTFEGFESPGVTTPVFTDSTTLNGGTDYTLVATGFSANTVVFLSFSDHNTAPNNGYVNFRVINASPNSPSGVDIWILLAPVATTPPPPAPMISNLAYQSSSGYITVPYNSGGGGFQVFVNTHNGGQIFNYNVATNGGLTSASICTLVLEDNANGSSMSFRPVVLNDLNCATN
ncbi:MAG: DUF4397 domain-containing protein [Terriglobales bacterium]|jgi:hypothetical protein